MKIVCQFHCQKKISCMRNFLRMCAFSQLDQITLFKIQKQILNIQVSMENTKCNTSECTTNPNGSENMIVLYFHNAHNTSCSKVCSFFSFFIYFFCLQSCFYVNSKGRTQLNAVACFEKKKLKNNNP